MLSTQKVVQYFDFFSDAKSVNISVVKAKMILIQNCEALKLDSANSNKRNTAKSTIPNILVFLTPMLCGTVFSSGLSSLRSMISKIKISIITSKKRCVHFISTSVLMSYPACARGKISVDKTQQSATIQILVALLFLKFFPL